MENQKSAETLQRRKFLMVLPLLVIPFLTMAFWALGGGKAEATGKIVAETKKGFNTELPAAKFSPDDKQDKFSIYETSAKETEKDDALNRAANQQLAFSSNSDVYTDPNEQKINEKLALINTELNRQSTSSRNYQSPKYSSRTSNMEADVNRLEDLMQHLQTGNGSDQEMTQLNAVLEKILDIQHPGRAREKLKENSSNRSNGSCPVQVVDGSEGNKSLYSLAKGLNTKYTATRNNSIQAVIHQDQDIVSGSVVKLRLIDSVYVNGTLIPKNEFIYGIAMVDGERLKVEVATLRFKNSILPVSLSAFDLDGLEGLYIPGAITRDASKKGVDDAIQSLQIMTMDPSVSAQVAGAGIQAAKGLFSKKIKQIRVKVKAGYQLLLRDNNQRN